MTELFDNKLMTELIPQNKLMTELVGVQKWACNMYTLQFHLGAV